MPLLTPSASDLEESIASQLANIHETRWSGAVVASAILVLLATLSVILRAWARKIAGAKYGADDYGVLVALIIVWTLNIIIWLGIKFGLGRHLIAVGFDNLEKVLKTIFAYEIIYVVSLTTSKIAILLLYHRVFIAPLYRRIFIGLGVWVTLWCISGIITIMLQCRPLTYNWDHTSQSGTCLDVVQIMVISGILNIVNDVLILVSPIPCVWRMHTSRSQKLLITGIFMLGGLLVDIPRFSLRMYLADGVSGSVTITSAIRLIYVKDFVSLDPTWTGTKAGIWSIIEPCMSVICACLPVMRPLLRGRRKSSDAASPSPRRPSVQPVKNWPGWDEKKLEQSVSPPGKARVGNGPLGRDPESSGFGMHRAESELRSHV